MTTTWRQLLVEEMQDRGDPGPVIAYAPDGQAFDVVFYAGYGLPEGPSVLAWTDTYVYFPVQYDGAEWLGSVPRHPVKQGQYHVGGG
jgi:hypothetical protein